jgi:hypothetical protein
MKTLIGPFGAQVFNIDNPLQICREHYDVFFAISTDKSKVNVDMREFTAYTWVDKAQAREKIELKYYKDALEKFTTFMDW